MASLLHSCTVWLTIFGLYTISASSEQLLSEHIPDQQPYEGRFLMPAPQQQQQQPQPQPQHFDDTTIDGLLNGLSKTKRSWQKLQGSWGKRSDFDGLEYADRLIAGKPYEATDAADFESASNNMLETYFDDLDEQNQQQQQNLEHVSAAKRAWKSMNGGWGKRIGKTQTMKSVDFEANIFLCFLAFFVGGTWGKREPGWNNLKGLWGKRGDWNKLQSAWGKRDVPQAEPQQSLY